MTTPAGQYERLRADVDASESALPNDEIDVIYAEAEESYTLQAKIDAQARVIALRRLMAQAVTLTDYDANESSESLGDLFDKYAKLLTYWQGVRDSAQATPTSDSAAPFFFGVASGQRGR